MSDDAYNNDDGADVGKGLPSHISRLGKDDRAKLAPLDSWQDKKTGFYARAYQNDNTNEVTIAFRGTDSRVDMKSNKAQAKGLFSPQYSQAIELAKTVEKSLGKASALSFTGHSLGGGLANASAISASGLNRSSKTFAPAALSRAKYGSLAKANDDIINYTRQGDPLTHVQDLAGKLGYTTFNPGHTVTHPPAGYHNNDINHVINSFSKLSLPTND